MRTNSSMPSMLSRQSFLARFIFCVMAGWAAPAGAYIADLRVTEVDPWGERVEIMNFNGGLFQLTSEIPTPYNHDFNNFKRMGITPGWVFAPNAIWTFEFPELSTWAGDVWLYSSDSYDSPTALIHGVQWGVNNLPERTNSEIAAAAIPQKWPSKTASCPVPPQSYTLSWDYDGYTPLDWYISASTMGALNADPVGTVDEPFDGIHARQTFETPSLGRQVTALKGWTMSASSGNFSVRFVGDVNGTVGTRPNSMSTRWLRIRDTDASGNNTFSSPGANLGDVRGYRCIFHVNQEIAPSAANATPALVFQNSINGSQWTDSWAVKFLGNRVEAAVLNGGGPPASVQLYGLSGATGVGQWVKIEIRLDLDNHELAASMNNGTPVLLPIDPTGDPQKVRITYQGGGAGNTQDMLLDDVAFSPYDPPVNAVKGWEDYR